VRIVRARDVYILPSYGFFGDINMAANFGDRYLDLIQKSVQNAIHGESQVEAMPRFFGAFDTLI
jgi:hypothetical protein